MWQLGVLLVLAAPIALVALIVAAVRQSGAITRLERRLLDLDIDLRNRINQLEHDLAERPARSSSAPTVAAAIAPAAPSVATPVSDQEATPAAGGDMPPPEPPAPLAEPMGKDQVDGVSDEARREAVEQRIAQIRVRRRVAGEQARTPEPPSEPPAPPPPPEPKPRFEWERFVGLRLPIWLGAIALCIAGFFFVSYAIESGFFTPEMRVLSAAAAALAFLAGAQFVRARLKTGNVAAIAAALAAAAIGTAYATVYLASITYGLVSTGFGFIATVAVSAVAIAVALAFGEIVALIGVAGAYLAPAVFGGGGGSTAFLVIYLVALTVVSFAVIRWKGWWSLAIVGLLGPACWGLIWVLAPDLQREAYWGDLFLLSLPLIVTIASWPGWREDGPIIGLRGFTAVQTPERGALVAATILSAIGFVLFLLAAGSVGGVDLGYWRGFIVYAALAVALGFVSSPHRALQVPILIAFAVALLFWHAVEPREAYVIIGAAAIIFGFGALDQFRRMREPGFWAAILAFIVLYLFAIALFKVNGWGVALVNRHYWAGAALVLAAGFLGLLRLYSPRLTDETERSRVYAAWGGAVTTLVSLAVVLEVDPLYFPAAAAVAILGLAAVHTRAPVRGLRVLAVVYLVVYGILLLGAFGSDEFVVSYHHYIFARAFETHSLILLVLPGIALLGAATLFHRDAQGTRLVPVFDGVGIVIMAIGLWFLFVRSREIWPFQEMYVTGGKVAAAELALALAAVDLGQLYRRRLAYTLGLILTGVTAVFMLGFFMAPLLRFWPDFAVPGLVILNISLLAFGLTALLLFAIGWLVRKDPRPPVHYYGIAISVFATLAAYTMIVVDIRQAWHLGAPTLEGATSQSEFYAYSIVTLVFGLVLLIGGLIFRHRGARALSLVFVLAATIKVFLVDAAELEGLWRVLSFLLMGFAFLGISWAYARFVFGIGVRPAAPATPPAEPPQTTVPPA